MLLSFDRLPLRGLRDATKIMCYGKNEMGTQRKPCIFILEPAGQSTNSIGSNKYECMLYFKEVTYLP